MIHTRIALARNAREEAFYASEANDSSSQAASSSKRIKRKKGKVRGKGKSKKHGNGGNAKENSLRKSGAPISETMPGNGTLTVDNDPLGWRRATALIRCGGADRTEPSSPIDKQGGTDGVAVSAIVAPTEAGRPDDGSSRPRPEKEDTTRYLPFSARLCVPATEVPFAVLCSDAVSRCTTKTLLLNNVGQELASAEANSFSQPIVAEMGVRSALTRVVSRREIQDLEKTRKAAKEKDNGDDALLAKPQKKNADVLQGTAPTTSFGVNITAEAFRMGQESMERVEAAQKDMASAEAELEGFEKEWSTKGCEHAINSATACVIHIAPLGADKSPW